MKIYLAHQITGLSYDQVMDYYGEMVAYTRGLGYDVLHPMTGKGFLRVDEYKAEGYDEEPTTKAHAIFERDRWMVTQADVLLIDLTGMTRASIGCMMELAWGSILGKHTIVVMEPDNPHRHAFVTEAADIVFDDIKYAKNYLAKLIRQDI